MLGSIGLKEDRMLRRRRFLALAAAAPIAQWPLLARAQKQQEAVIGIITQFSRDSIVRGPYFSSFLAGLADLGLVEGRNMRFEYGPAEGHYDRLPALTAGLVDRHVAVIVTFFGGSTVAVAVKAAALTTPIVFLVGVDPVALGLVESLNRPGGRVTGVDVMSIQLVAKQMQLLDGLLPKGMPIAALGNRSSPFDRDLSNIESAAAKLGRPLVPVLVSDEQEFPSAFETIRAKKAGGLFVTGDQLFTAQRLQLIETVDRNQLPAIYANREMAADGGLMSYSPDYPDAFHQVGVYAGRIIHGESPAELPVIQGAKFQLVINLKTAHRLGLVIPPMILALADEVIED
jgi:putative ABC transport system substrate-binding protein